MNKIIHHNDPAFSDLWETLVAAGNNRHPLYTHLSMEYYKEYYKGTLFRELSFIVQINHVPLLGTLCTLHEDDESNKRVTAYNCPVFFLTSPNLNADNRKKALQMFKTEMDRILEELDADSLYFQDPLLDGCLSSFSHYLLSRGAVAAPYFTRLINLSLAEKELHRSLTKSYRWSINWGIKNMDIDILDAHSIQMGDMEAFRRLHMEVSGRETRSRRSWDIQYEMVKQGEAFVVFGKLGEELVTAALFIYTQAHCFYGVSASKRELFDKPLSHAILWKAIFHAKTLGIRCFETGKQDYPRQKQPFPSAKELGITAFKRGFGGETRTFLDVRLEKLPQENENQTNTP